jgi:hypothetical protein
MNYFQECSPAVRGASKIGPREKRQAGIRRYNYGKDFMQEELDSRQQERKIKRYRGAVRKDGNYSITITRESIDATITSNGRDNQLQAIGK